MVEEPDFTQPSRPPRPRARRRARPRRRPASLSVIKLILIIILCFVGITVVGILAGIVVVLTKSR